MSQQRETTTNNLADIIQLIQIGHRTGTLTVERGNGNSYEEGNVVFVNGHITEAKNGPYYGPTALGALTTWTTCRFAFIVAMPPAYNTGPLNIQSQPMQLMPPQPTTRQLSTNPNMRSIVPIPPTQITGPNHSLVSMAQSTVNIPYRTQAHNNVLAYMEQAGLTREHRRLFMLIDGQRTTQEIISLMGKIPEKMLELLSDLEKHGLIRQR